jgi:hypothetical protein
MNNDSMTTGIFKIDNVWLQTMSHYYGQKRSVQLHLPGMEPFTHFDAWATLALYSTLDPKEPHKPVRIKPTDLLKLLKFTKIVADAEAGYESFPTQNYRMIEESLHRLRTVELTLTWSKTEKKKGKSGRPRKLTFERHTSVLWAYTYIYEDDEGEFTGEQLPPGERVNVNEALTLDNEPGPPIYRADRRRYKEIEYRMSDELITGLRGADGGIGFTPAPLRIFELRPKLHDYPTATKLLVWSLRQVRPEGEPIKIDVDKLVVFTGLKGRNRSRNRESIINYLGMLQEYGVLEQVNYDRRNNQISFFRSKQWQFGGAIETKEEEKEA